MNFPKLVVLAGEFNSHSHPNPTDWAESQSRSGMPSKLGDNTKNRSFAKHGQPECLIGYKIQKEAYIKKHESSGMDEAMKFIA